MDPCPAMISVSRTDQIALHTMEHLSPRPAARNRFSQRVEDFVAQHIRAVWQLELLLLVKSNQRPTSSAELSRKLYIEARVLEPAIESFASAGILKRDQQTSRISYLPESEGLASDIEETAKAYRERRTALINFIHAPF